MDLSLPEEESLDEDEFEDDLDDDDELEDEQLDPGDEDDLEDEFEDEEELEEERCLLDLLLDDELEQYLCKAPNALSPLQMAGAGLHVLRFLGAFKSFPVMLVRCSLVGCTTNSRFKRLVRS